MNRILLRAIELNSQYGSVLPADDYRAKHLREILKAQPGSLFEAGILHTQISGKFKIQEIGHDGSISGHFIGAYDASQKLRWQSLSLGMGMMRPPVLKRLLRDFASAGVEGITLIQTELCEGAYRQSHVWERLEHYLILGAEQGRINRLPQLLHGQRQGLSLAEYLAKVKQLREERSILPQNCIVLDERGGIRNSLPVRNASSEHRYIIALGPERGWTMNELQAFLDNGFTDCSLGPVTLRTEVAAHLALGLYLREMQGI